MNKLYNSFPQHWANQFKGIPLKGQDFLVAISGGLDSIVLSHLMHLVGANIQLAHCNFNLRGAESDQDELFVKEFAATYNLKLHTIHFDTSKYASESKLSIQEAARKLRYEWFGQLRKELNIQWLLTAHHADDNIETVLMHFFRGTGIKGLTGIPVIQKEQSILRPLLEFHKEELKNYVAENGLTYREDSSNSKEDYTRNFFRLNLLPQIKTVYPQVENNLLHNIQRLKEVQEIYDSSIDKIKLKLLVYKGNEVHIPVLLLQKTTPLNAIIWEIIKDYGFNAAQIDEVIKLMGAHTGSYIQSGTHRIILNRNWLILTPLETTEANNILIEYNDTRIKLSDGLLDIDRISINEQFTIPIDNNIACVDMKELQFPLLIRPWKQGDYFYPLGMEKKKKLSRYFIDQKFSLTQKEKIMVLETAGRIIWIIGERIDNRFRIKPNSKEILKITYNRTVV